MKTARELVDAVRNEIRVPDEEGDWVDEFDMDDDEATALIEQRDAEIRAEYEKILDQASQLLEVCEAVPGSKFSRYDAVIGGIEKRVEEVPELAAYLQSRLLKLPKRTASPTESEEK